MSALRRRFAVSPPAPALLPALGAALLTSLAVAAAPTALMAQKNAPIVSTAPHNGINRDVGLCGVAGCFESTVSYTTPSYVSLGVEHAVTLVWSGRHVFDGRVVQLDVRDNSSTKPDKFSLVLRRPDGAYVTFVNGAQSIFYARASDTTRLAAHFGADEQPGYPVGAPGRYTYTAVVTSWWSDGSQRSTEVPVRVLTANHAESHYGFGWEISGLQKIYTRPGVDWSAVVTDGAGSAAYFEAYEACDAQTCTYKSPAGDFSTLRVWQDNVTGPDGDTRFERRYPDGTVVRFNGDGNVRYVLDRFGNRTTYSWYSKYNLESITDPAGKVTTFGYTLRPAGSWPAYLLSSITDPGGRVTRINMDAAGDLVSIVDASDTVAFRAEYDGGHMLQRWYDRGGHQRDVEYDLAGKVRTHILPSVTVGGQAVRPVVRYSSVESVVLKELWAGKGAAATPIPAIRSSTVRAAVREPSRGVTRYQVDRFGAVLRAEEPLGRTTVTSRNTHAQVTRSESPSGHVVKYQYAGPDLTMMTDSTLNRVTTMAYESTYHDLMTRFAPGDSLWQYWSGGKLDSARTGTSTAKVAKYAYDVRGRVLRATDPMGHETTYNYHPTVESAGGNVSAVTNVSRQTRYYYDRYGRDSVIVDPIDRRVRVLYDPLNRVLANVGPNADTTRYQYNYLHLTAVRDAKGQTHTYTPNALGWVERETDPRGVSRTAQYDSAGNVVRTVNRRGQAVTVTYDSLGQLTSRTAGGATTAYKTDPDGRWTMTANAASRDTIYFDRAGRKTGEATWRGGLRFGRASTYDGRGYRTGLAFSVSNGWNYQVGYVYDARGDLVKLTAPIGDTTYVKYDARHLPTEIRLPSNTVVSHAYPSVGRPSRTAYTIGGGLSTVLGSKYSYDGATRVYDRFHADGVTGRSYQFDPAGRLTQSANFAYFGECTPYYEGGKIIPDPDEKPIGWTCPPRTNSNVRTYAYDKVGNRTDRLAVTGPGNRLTGFDETALSYDADGNIVGKWFAPDPAQYDLSLYWNPTGQLDSARRETGAITRFSYDGWGRRTQKRRANGTVANYVYDGDNLIAEYDGAGSDPVYYSYYPGVDRPHGLWHRYSQYYYAQDAEDNVVGLLSTAGSLVNEYKYTPFGQGESEREAIPNPLRFKAREYDAETGLYYMRARYYDPHTTRFMSEDPIGLDGGINTYVFAENDPVNLSDPYGLAGCKNQMRRSDGQELPCVVIEGGGGMGGGFLSPMGRGGSGYTPSPGGGEIVDFGAMGGQGGTAGQPAAGDQVEKAAKALLACATDHYGLNALLGAVGAGAVYAGQSNVPKRFVTPGSSAATSRASVFFRTRVTTRLPSKVWAPTWERPLATSAKLGTVLGRWTPIVGWGLLAYDAYRIGSCVATEY